MNLLEKIKDAGVIGAGGAGFPTHIKLKCKVEVLIINGAECEPLLKTDQYLMRERTEELVEAIEMAGKEVGAEKIYLAVKKKYGKEIEALKSTIARRDSPIQLFFLDNFFPAGDEQVLVYEVTGRTVPPGGIPLQSKALVSNVGTMINIYEALQGKPVTHKYIAVLGEVKDPKLLKVPVGTSAARCIAAAGGPLTEDYCVIMGGPMMGQIIDDVDIHHKVIKKTDSALIVLDKDHYIVKRNRTPMAHIINQSKSACIQCRFCTDLCPRYLIGHPLRPHKIMGAIATKTIEDEAFREALICCDCGICELYACPMGLSPRLVNGYLKGELRKRGIAFHSPGTAVIPSESRDYRKIPVNRLIARIGLEKYTYQMVDSVEEIQADQVSIPLRQHIGVAAEAMVAVGDWVERGQCIGKIEDGKLGANIHASIGGRVTAVGQAIDIKQEEGVME
ncbi:Na+-translocating ferredoxin:NAD+ oxidoreductase RNF, RnfC subunit [Geosporobacter subterraneus DSM 17957]|uniref:Na+-translocating ferredoxin:NAD+ oxidoreductase RNF, RnfC subunit n=1 Tax=Geosporobacter subterraneus DSM 17957 TaxID=1121919 RepID=A0A1M6JSK3_9FIRM|nr:4Fe-4S dicluster domain-containing protein [Geosporobacter subterraneus]SHJ49626.1 Na+-translocating ferredoxin:NAD+ oxidoreductase RNF, RnfC subunit [Geosporobacter subterraneus DSM 17957]